MAGKQAIVRVAIVADNLGLTKGLADSQSKMAKFGKTLAKGAAVAGVVAGAGLLKMAEAAAEDQKAQALLAQQLRNTAGATDDQIASVEDWITAQGKALGVADDDLRPALAKLATATGDVAEAQDLASIAMDVAAGTGKDLASVSAALAKAQNGSLGGLSKLGIATKDAAGETMTLAQVTDSLRQKFAGDAATAAGTAAGQFERVKLQLSELAEDIGGAVLPTLTALGGWLIDEGVPALEDMGAAVKAELGPALADLREWVAENHDGLEDFGSTVLSVVVPALETTGHIVGEAVALFSKLPGPVKEAAAIAVIASLVFKNKLKPSIDQATVSAKANIATFQQWRAEMTYTETRAGAVATATGKLAGAAKMAAGAAGLALLAASANETNETLAGLEQTAGTVALGFSAGGPWGAAIAYAIDSLNKLRAANDDWKASLDAVNTARATGSTAAYAAAIDDAREKTDEATLHFGDLVKGGQSVQFALDAGRKALNTFTGATGDANSELDAQEAALNGVETGTRKLLGPVYDAIAGYKTSAQVAEEEATALDQATDAMKAHRQESLKGLNAELDYQAAIDDATAAIKENGATSDKTTEKGRANRRALYELADAWNAQDKSAKNAKGSLQAAQQNFLDTAAAMKVPKAEAKRLADQLFEIPEKRKTKIELEGIDKAKTDVQSLITLLSNVKDRSVTITTRYNTQGRPAESALPGDRGKVAAETAATLFAQMFAAGARSLDAINTGLDNVATHIENITEKNAKLVERIADKHVAQVKRHTAQLVKDHELSEKAAARRVERAEKAAAKRVRAAQHAGAQIVKSLQAQFDALKAIGLQQDENATAIENARNAYNAYAADVRQSFVDFGNITELGRGSNGRVSLTRLLAQLRKRADQAHEFSDILQRLAAAGLDQTQIEQLQQAGVETGLATAKAIESGGATAIQQINDMSRDIAKTGGVLGDALADRFAISGRSSATAYIAELEANQATLNATAEAMALAYVSAVQSQLANVTGGGGGKHHGGKQGQQPSRDAVKGDRRDRIAVTLTAQQMSAIERGRRVQLDIDAYRKAGGRQRA